MKLIQRESFGEELRQIQKNEMVNGNIMKLNPFIGNDGLLRVGGRIKHAVVKYDTKHQIILPYNHHVTSLIISAFHIEHCHVGQSGLLAVIRQQFWPIQAAKSIKKIISRCVSCFKARPTDIKQFMGDLPNYRVTPSSPFERVGIDYAGPILLKQRQRKAAPVKAYIALFVCMNTKAIHIELVSDLTSNAFIGALQRFVNRRGNPTDIFTDNGSTFIGARKELGELRLLFQSQHHRDKLETFYLEREICWHFIPPRSPHFGGLWEAGVKSMKYYLKRCLGESMLTYEEMCTLLVQIEGILNSRPLIPNSNDVTDLQVITPGHFLIGRAITAIAEPSYENLKQNTLSRFQYIQYVKQHFWRRWSTEYLTQLQQRSKWFDKPTVVKEGMLVLLKDENQPPQSWKTGRLIKTHPGHDNIIRVVTIQTNTGIYKRSTAKIVILPVLDDEESSAEHQKHSNK